MKSTLRFLLLLVVMLLLASFGRSADFIVVFIFSALLAAVLSAILKDKEKQLLTWTKKQYGYGCAECCTGDRCDEDCTAKYRRGNCPHCKNGWIPETDANFIGKVAILSFKEPSKEIHITRNDLHAAGILSDANIECLEQAGLHNALDFKEPSSERPDFESPRQMIIRLAEEYRGKGKLEKSTEEESSYAWGASRIWHDHVIPRDEKIKHLERKAEYWEDAHAHLEVKLKTEIQSLEQEIERLREELKSKQ